MKQNRKKDSAFQMDVLESRTLLSHGFGRFEGFGRGFGGPGFAMNTIEYSQAPAAVQQGLSALATSDGLTPPAADSTQAVYMRNAGGVESYSIMLTGTGTRTTLTVDQNGQPVTPPTSTTITWGTLSGSNTAAADEISTIATALNLTAPADTTPVNASTTAGGVSTYTVRLSSANSTGGWRRHDRGTAISVDSNGNPVGNENLPFSTMPSAIQNGINANLPAGVTALDAASTQTVNVRTNNGVTTYSTTFNSTGTRTTMTVDASGALANLPSRSSDQFQNIPAAAQTELQTLATADGASGTISTSQNVTVYDEANGTKIYSVRLAVSKTGSNGNTYTRMITLSVDQLGNPTVPPQGGDVYGGGGFGFGSISNAAIGGSGFRFSGIRRGWF